MIVRSVFGWGLTGLIQLAARLLAARFVRIIEEWKVLKWSSRQDLGQEELREPAITAKL